MRRLPTRWFIVLFVCICVHSLIGGVVTADEPVEAFLEELRLRGYYDTAVDYLDSLEKSSLCPPDFRPRIPFEKAVTLIEAAKTLKDPRKNEAYMDRAETWLAEYSKSNPPPDMLARSEKLKAQLYYGRAIVYLRSADSDRKTEAEKNDLRAKARTLFTLAWDTLKKSADFTKAKFDGIVDDPERPLETKALKTKVYNEYIQIRLITAMTAESMAETFPSGTAERTRQLEVALTEHEYNRERFRNKIQGLHSIVGVARVSHQLGKQVEAIGACVEIFEQADISDLLPLKKQAAMIAAEIWQEQKPLPHADIIGHLEPIINSLGNVEQRQSDWLDLQVLLARAFRAKAEKYEQSETKDAKTRSTIKNSNEAAVRLARRIARIPGPTREVARKMLVDWNLTVGSLPDEDREIKTFEQARLQGRDLMADVEMLRTAYLESKEALAAAGDNASSELQQNYQNAMQELQAKTDEVHAVLAKALELSTPDTLRDEIASVRYLQAYGYFATERYFETIVIGQYLLSHFPNSTATRDASSLAVKAYLQLLLKADAEQMPFEFEYQNLKQIADTMLDKWPGQAATETAAVIMSRLSTQRKDYEAAEAYVKAIPASSSSRVAEELRLGQIFWFQYVNRTRDADEATRKKFVGLREKAKLLLEKNVAQLQTRGLTPTNARAALSLTDLYLDEGNVQAAIEQLENAAVAPLDLIKQKHESALSDKFESDTYKTAIRAYMAAMQDGSQASKWVQRAQGVLRGLKAALEKEDPQTADAKLRSVYIQLAKESKQQMGRITDASEKTAFGDSLLQFLSVIASSSDDGQTLLWTGQTLNGLGMSMSEAGDPDAARRLHLKAIDAFKKAKAQGVENVAAADKEKIEIEMERQLAIALRGTGKFDTAIKKFADLLERKAYIDIQIDAALTYQMKGDASSHDPALQARAYRDAMMGGERRKRPNRRAANVIWGWNALCHATKNKPKFEQQFYECLYNMCYSRLQFGRIQKNTKAYTSALTEINRYAGRSETMGGLRDKFQKLAGELYTALGQKPRDLPAFDPSSNTSSSTNGQ